MLNFLRAAVLADTRLLARANRLCSMRMIQSRLGSSKSVGSMGSEMKIERYVQTDRLFLSPLSWSDLAFFFRLIGNRDVRRFLGGPVPLSARLSCFNAYHRVHPNAGIWIVRDKVTGKSLGIIELTPHKDGEDYEISYQFHPSSWGKGFARQATCCVINHAVSDLGFERIIAETQAANTRSCRFLENLGFVKLDKVERFGVLQKIYSTK